MVSPLPREGVEVKSITTVKLVATNGMIPIASLERFLNELKALDVHPGNKISYSFAGTGGAVTLYYEVPG